MNTEYWLSEARLFEPYDLMDFASSVLQILFSTPREEKCGFTVPFYSVQDCTLWNRLFFFVFFRRAEEIKARSGGGGRVARVLRSTPDPRLASLTWKTPKNKNNNNNNNVQNKEKREKTGENDKICSLAMGGINYVYLHDVLAPRSYPIFTLEPKYGGRSRRRSDNEKAVF